MKRKNGFNRLGDNPSLLQCLLEDASTNIMSALADALVVSIELADRLERRLKRKNRNADKM